MDARPASTYADRPYEVQWLRRAYLSTIGPATPGTLVDSEVDVRIHVGYLESSSGRIATQNDSARDELAIRLAIEDPQNWDSANSGIVSVECVESERHDADEEGLCMLEISVRMVVYDTVPMSVPGWG